MKTKTAARNPTVIRTLGLPCQFQLVLGKLDVRKVDAQRGFSVRHRGYSGFRLAVARVHHTKRAFVKYLLHRFKAYLREFTLDNHKALANTLYSSIEQPALFPTPKALFALTKLLCYAGDHVVRAIGRKLAEELQGGPGVPELFRREPQVPVGQSAYRGLGEDLHVRMYGTKREMTMTSNW